jgi:hypothetical protein
MTEKEVSDLLEELRVESGLDVNKNNTLKLSQLRKSLPKGSVPEGMRIADLNKFFRNRQKDKNAKIRFVPQGSDKGKKIRTELSDYPGQTSRIIENELRRSTKTNQLYEILSSDLGYEDSQIAKYFYEVDRDLKELLNEVATKNKTLPRNQRISFGHLHRLSKSINSPRNVFIELLNENIDKGDRYSLNPAGQLAIGNPIKEGSNWLENWKRDFLLWADKTENGGTGVLPQRGDYGSLLEQKYRELTGTQWEKLDDAAKQKAIIDIDELTTSTEKLNQWNVNQGKQLQEWGILNPDQKTQVEAWYNSDEFRSGSLTKEVTKPGGRLGGEPTYMRKTRGKGWSPHLMRDGILGTSFVSSLAMGARGFAEVVDVTIPDKSTIETFKTKGVKEGFKAYGNELFAEGKALVTTMGLLKGASYLPFVKGAANVVGQGASRMAWPLLATSIANQVDDSFFDSKGKKAIHKGLTNIVKDEEEEKSRNYLGSYSPY